MADEVWTPVGPYGDDDPHEPAIRHGDDLLTRMREVADHGGTVGLESADVQVLFTILERATYAERAEIAELRSRLAETERELRENTRLRRVLTRIASPDELTGDGPLEPILADPHGCAERELRARMMLAQHGLDGDDLTARD